METRANYLMVGAFVLALAGGLVGFVLWLAKFQFDVQFAHYDIHVEGTVTGLNIGSAVRYRGVRVGEVTEVRLDPDQPEQITVTIEVDAGTPVRSNTTATLELAGLTGGQYVLLSGTTMEAPPLEAKPGERRPAIKAERSTLQQVFEGAPELVQKVNILLARGNDLLNDQNRGEFAAILANLSVFTGTLADQGPEIGAFIENANATMENLRDASGALQDLATTLKADGTDLIQQTNTTVAAIGTMASEIERSVGTTAASAQGLITDLQNTAQKYSDLGGELEGMVAENREPIRDFTSTGLSELTVLLIEMQDLVIALNRVTGEIERDPARFFFGNRQEGYETR